MDQRIVERTYWLIDEIKATPAYRALEKTFDEMASDKEVKRLVARFRVARDAYREVEKYARHHPDWKKKAKAFQEAKEALYGHPLIRAYNENRRRVQEILDSITPAIAKAVSEQIPTERTILKETEEGGSLCETARASSSTSKAPGCSKGSRR